ncbi:MAG: hypothetical protein KIT79_12715 [Deltaproteobacteria bacterium]|nr:hypothetical protein [Deltaproteobacteria bacterium]
MQAEISSTRPLPEHRFVEGIDLLALMTPVGEKVEVVTDEERDHTETVTVTAPLRDRALQEIHAIASSSNRIVLALQRIEREKLYAAFGHRTMREFLESLSKTLKKSLRTMEESHQIARGIHPDVIGGAIETLTHKKLIEVAKLGPGATKERIAARVVTETGEDRPEALLKVSDTEVVDLVGASVSEVKGKISEVCKALRIPVRGKEPKKKVGEFRDKVPPSIRAVDILIFLAGRSGPVRTSDVGNHLRKLNGDDAKNADMDPAATRHLQAFADHGIVEKIESAGGKAERWQIIGQVRARMIIGLLEQAEADDGLIQKVRRHLEK